MRLIDFEEPEQFDILYDLLFAIRLIKRHLDLGGRFPSCLSPPSAKNKRLVRHWEGSFVSAAADFQEHHQICYPLNWAAVSMAGI